MSLLLYERWEGEALGLALWEARISRVLTMGCGVRHFLTVGDLDCVPVFVYLEIQHLSVTGFFLGRYSLGMYGTA